MKSEKKFDAIKKFVFDRKYALWLLLWVGIIVWYFLLNQFQTGGHVIHMSVDDKIPFVEYFVIFYCLWYAYIVFSLLWTLVKSKRDFLTLCSLIFLALYSSMIVITAYPSVHTLRPAAGSMRNNLFSALVRGIYAADEPRCIFPSMHCILVIVISVGLIFSDSFKGKLWTKIFCPLFSVLVMLSTVFIKQHSVADVLLSMGMSVPVCLLTYFVVTPKKRFAPKEQKKEIPPLEETMEKPPREEENSAENAE